jgi:hypothetical protein
MFGLPGSESNPWDESMSYAGSTFEAFELKGAALPSTVAAFINAVNSSDLEGLMGAFAKAALMNDRLREF